MILCMLMGPLFVSAQRFLHVRGCFSVRGWREGPVSAAGHEGERHSLYRLQLSPQQPRRLQPRNSEHPGEGNERQPRSRN